jgi:uncharacterized oxidoreductase
MRATVDISGKRVLVTGAATGIGLQIARELLERGARIVITGRRQAALDEAMRPVKASLEEASRNHSAL